MTAGELDERLEAALSARTLGELAPLTADLGAMPGRAGLVAPRAKGVVPDRPARRVGRPVRRLDRSPAARIAGEVVRGDARLHHRGDHARHAGHQDEHARRLAGPGDRTGHGRGG
ncbi:MAG: DUF1707 domain-containing protein [Streptosporangiales bacterium]